MFFILEIHVHSPSGYLCLGMSERRVTHTAHMQGYWKTNYIGIEVSCVCLLSAWFIPIWTVLQGSTESALPLASCPCRRAIDMMTEETVYADKAQDVQEEFASNGDLSCHSEMCACCVCRMLQGTDTGWVLLSCASCLITLLSLLFRITSVFGFALLRMQRQSYFLHLLCVWYSL